MCVLKSVSLYVLINQDVDPKKGYGPPLSNDDIDFLYTQAFPVRRERVRSAVSMTLQDREELQVMFLVLQGESEHTVVLPDSKGIGVSIQDTCAYALRSGCSFDDKDLAEMDIDLNGYVDEDEFVEFMFTARMKAMEKAQEDVVQFRLDKQVRDNSAVKQREELHQEFRDDYLERLNKYN